METIKVNPLPSIFRFSVLANILPFFGQLHRWVWLLQRCSKKTQQIWIDNKNMFMQWGKPYKDERPIDLLHLVDKDRDLIQNRYMYFRYFYICEIYLEDFIELYLPQSTSLIALFDINYNEEYRNYRYKVILLKKEDLSDWIPSVKCIKYNQIYESFEWG